jgi:flagellar M-ring protein FliF
MDFTHIEQTEENYDPDKVAVRSEQRSTEKSSVGNPFAVRAPGGMANTPDLKETEKGALPSKSVNYDKNDETINYEISHVVKKTINPVGTIERITAAVLIDGTYKIAKDKDGKEVRNYVPRSGDEMAKYSALVKKALGYDKDRGDSVEVVNVQFNETGFEPETVTDRFIRQIDWQSMITYLITAILFALFFIYGLKPLLKILSKTVEKVEVAGRFTDRGQETGRLETDEFPHGIPTPGAVKPGEKEGQLLNFAKTNPKLFAQYLKSWIR